ncbi:Heparan-alpha-glucosaminide N-acetyltransferase [Halotydeus destructor]|nr:Heparan-alpha-glucosaminide N-acetyltransferase [Halotydeus destructor]
MIQLGLDEALLRIHNNCTSALDVFTQVSECLKCPTVYRATALASNWSDVTLNTKYDSIVEVKLTNGDRICTMPHSGYEDHGSYQLDVYETQLDGRYDCQLRQIESGRNGTLPFILIVLLYAILITGYTIGKKLYKVYLTVNSSPNVSHYDQIPEADIEEDTTEVCEASPLIVQSSDRSTPQPARHRLQGLDSFRGLTILLMIYVNYGGGGYSMLAHKPWFGLTIADTIFPCFIFIMGISVALSVRKQVVAKEPFKSVVCQMIRRSVNLFLLGLMINSIKQSKNVK